jgi:phosphoenolpyruvate carboxylase
MHEVDRTIEFRPEDTPLRDDVSMLGHMLGELLVEQNGVELFQHVEEARRAAITRRETESPITELEAALNDLGPAMSRGVVRAFSAYFTLTNLAEQVHRIRRRRTYLSTRSTPQPASLDDVVARLKHLGMSRRQVCDLFSGTIFSPVFTAHPTQATRRTILGKEQRIATLLTDRVEQPVRTPMEDRKLLERLRSEATLIWQTEEQPVARPSVGDEVESVVFVLTEVLYRAVPAFFEAFRAALEAHWGAGAARGVAGPNLRFGSWVGGDMDGNPNVDAETIRNTLERHRHLVIALYRDEVRRLYDHLSQGASRVRVDPRIGQRVALYSRTMPGTEDTIHERHRSMPYRVFLWMIWERLGATETDSGHGYPGVHEFVDDLELIAASLRDNQGSAAGLGLVRRLLERVRTFGFHLATLDLRQDALAHRQACAQLLDDADFVDSEPEVRIQRLQSYLEQPTERRDAPDGPLRRALDVFRTADECRRRFGGKAIGPMIISMAEGPDDVLAVLALARAAGVRDHNAGLDLDVAPLFETVDDLEAAGATMKGMLDNPLYRRHLDSRSGRQIVMLGYSDSSKISGLAASRWALHQAQEDLVRISEAAGVGLTLFHGRGGTVGRGGSKPRDGVLATPCGAVRGRLRVTEQGEIITAKYGLRSIAERSLEVAVGAVVEATATCDGTARPDPAWRDVMRTVAQEGRRAYDDLVHNHPDFIDYFRAATPIDVIERLGLGSRPASRRSGGGVENLRAIPWVFSWTQNRHLLPGWYGVGAGLEAAILAHGRDLLLEMAARWRFFSTLLGDVSMVLAKADIEIGAAYAALAGRAGERVFPIVRDAHATTCRIVLDLREEKNLLDHEPQLQRSIRLRNPYIDPMSLIQVDLLRKWRATDRTDQDLELALFETVRGIARGLRNTG